MFQRVCVWQWQCHQLRSGQQWLCYGNSGFTNNENGTNGFGHTSGNNTGLSQGVPLSPNTVRRSYRLEEAAARFANDAQPQGDNRPWNQIYEERLADFRSHGTCAAAERSGAAAAIPAIARAAGSAPETWLGIRIDMVIWW